MKWRASIKSLFERRGAVLMYHRVADVAIDPWQLAVSPENFEAQVKLLCSRYHVIPVAELIQNLQQKKLAPNSVCITFDDGYTDNLLFAKPILEKYNCPATFFIPSQFIGTGVPFWWDELQTLLLEAPQLPQLFQMPIGEESVTFNLKEDAVLTPAHVQKHQQWHWPDEAPTRRCALYLKLWEHLKPLAYADIEAVMGVLKSWAGYQPPNDAAQLPMTDAQLKALVQNKRFTLGLHTTSHPALAYHTEDVQYWELAENKKRLQPFNPINAVAFPYGNYNSSTLAVLQRQRISAGFTTEAKRLTTASKLQCLSRFQVLNEGAAAFEKTLQTWLAH